jgi:hypothetical protein
VQRHLDLAPAQSCRARLRAALLKVKAPMASHGKGFDRTSMSGAAIAVSCGWFHFGWFHLRACRSSDTAGRAI